MCTFEAKWDESHPSYAAVQAVNPAKLSARLLRQFESLTLESAATLGLSGYARVDFRLDKKGRPHVLEINPNPDLSPRMGIAAAAQTAGLGYPEFMQKILQLGLIKGVR